MRRSKAIVAALAVAALAGAFAQRIAFRPKERAELQYEDGSTVMLAGSPEVDEFAAHARAALASR